MSFEEFITRKIRLDEKLYKVEEKIAALRAQAEKSTTSLTLAPGGNAYNDSRLEELVIKIADLEAERGMLYREIEGVSAELSSFLSDLVDPYQMSVLIERYVNIKTVEQIMEILNRSKSFVKVKHRRGFAEAKKLYENKTRES
ncbi:MAG: hypothetical protein IJ237_02840 [Oscillospiraceae bacterium]|nr:hypothetical protein [Oscillospiraceae bacterium]